MPDVEFCRSVAAQGAKLARYELDKSAMSERGTFPLPSHSPVAALVAYVYRLFELGTVSGACGSVEKGSGVSRTRSQPNLQRLRHIGEQRRLAAPISKPAV